MLGHFAAPKQTARTAGRLLLAVSPMARAVLVCATWRDDRPPGSYFWCLLESSAEFSLLFNCSTNRCPTSSADGGFCPVMSSRSTTTCPVHGMALLVNPAPARCIEVCGQTSHYSLSVEQPKAEQIRIEKQRHRRPALMPSLHLRSA